eukprot:6301248-Pyramimonas_sp.AAC.1
MSWNEWRGKALKGSARFKHEITRLQQQRCPTAVEKAPGIFSSSPGAVMDAEVESRNTHRRATAQAPTASARS